MVVKSLATVFVLLIVLGITGAAYPPMPSGKVFTVMFIWLIAISAIKSFWK